MKVGRSIGTDARDKSDQESLEEQAND